MDIDYFSRSTTTILAGPGRELWRAVALRSFQAANGLPPTGDLDEATSNKLADVFGC